MTIEQIDKLANKIDDAYLRIQTWENFNRYNENPEGKRRWEAAIEQERVKAVQMEAELKKYVA